MSDVTGIHLDFSTTSDTLTIVSTHPEIEHRRRIAFAAENGRLKIDWGYETASPPTRRSAGNFTDATAAFALKGELSGAQAILEALNYPRSERDGIARYLSEKLPELAPASLSAVIDVRAIEAVKATVSPSILNLEFFSGDGERADRRRQAAAGMPLFSGHMSSTLSLKMTVDRSKPLMDAVIEAFNGRASGTISKASVRRLAGISEQPFKANIDTVVEFSSRIPPDWIPAAGNEWRAFCLIADGVVNQLRLSPEETTSFLKGCSGRWVDFTGRFVAPLVDRRDDDIQPEGIDTMVPLAFSNLSEMLNCFVNVVVVPLSVHGSFVSDVTVNAETRSNAFDLAKKMIFGEKSAPSLVSMFRKWQTQRAAILNATNLREEERRRELLKDVPINGWPALCNPVTAKNGLTLVPLTSPEQLDWEADNGADPNGSKGLNHCVHGFSNNCRTGESHIVSIRLIDENGAYQRLSTVEFSRLSPTSDHLTVAQHRGHTNGTPADKAEDALAWFKDAVAMGDVRLNRQLIEAFDRIVLEGVDGVQRAAGYDWRDADVLSQAIAPWGHYVDASYRNLGFEGLLAMDDLQPVRDTIAPELIGSASAVRR
jgi:hypothetical protein